MKDLTRTVLVKSLLGPDQNCTSQEPLHENSSTRAVRACTRTNSNQRELFDQRAEARTRAKSHSHENSFTCPTKGKQPQEPGGRMLALAMLSGDEDAPDKEDALAHTISENDEESLPHGALTRWYAMERQQFKEEQRQGSNENSLT